MKKKHILRIGHQYYAFESITGVTNVLKAIEKAIPVKWRSGDPGEKSYFENEDRDHLHHPTLELHQRYKPPTPPKPEKILTLPKPRRGVIRCQCGMADVAPRSSCPSCGTPFSISHNRTHKDPTIQTQPTLRLL